MKNLEVVKQQEVLGKELKVYGSFESPLFLAKDVANWIEHSDVSMMLNSVDDDEKIKIFSTISNTSNPCKPTERTGSANRMFLTEDGLYEVLMLSRKPIAKEFKKEVKKILKSVRKNGMYAKDELLDNPDLLLDVVSRLKKERDEKIRLQIENEQKEKLIVEMQPKVDFTDKFLTANNSLLIREFAKVLKEDGFDTGEKRLYTWLRDNGILMKNNEPYQRYMDYFDVVERSYEAGNSIRITKTTRIKPNGQLYIFKRLKKEFNL